MNYLKRWKNWQTKNREQRSSIMAYVFATIAVLVLLGAHFTTVALRRRLWRITHYERFARQFHEAVKPLISDDETPEEILSAIRFMNLKIVDSSAAREFFQLVSSGAIDVASAKPSTSIAKTREFFARRPELEPSFAEATAAGMLAMTFLSPFYGNRVRLWFTALDSKDSRERVAIAFGRIGSLNGPNGCPLPA